MKNALKGLKASKCLFHHQMFLNKQVLTKFDIQYVYFIIKIFLASRYWRSLLCLNFKQVNVYFIIKTFKTSWY